MLDTLVAQQMKPNLTVPNINIPDPHVRVSSVGVPKQIKRVAIRISSLVFKISIGYLFCTLPALATTILCLLQPDKIYIGADSQAIIVDDNGGTSQTACKITRGQGGYLFAIAGLPAYAKTGLDIPAIARSVTRASAETLRSRVERFEKLLAPKLRVATKSIQANSPETYRTWILGHQLQTVFAGWEKGSPIAFTSIWRFSTPGNVIPDGPKQIGKDVEDFLMLGFHEAADAYWVAHPELQRMSVPEAFSKLIQEEIDAAKSDPLPAVGPPISVIVMDRGGSHWMDTYKGACK
jgi:hypothetical protein